MTDKKLFDIEAAEYMLWQPDNSSIGFIELLEAFGKGKAIERKPNDEQ